MCLVIGANFNNHENSCLQTSVFTSCVEKVNGKLVLVLLSSFTQVF